MKLELAVNQSHGRTKLASVTMRLITFLASASAALVSSQYVNGTGECIL